MLVHSGTLSQDTGVLMVSAMLDCQRPYTWKREVDTGLNSHISYISVSNLYQRHNAWFNSTCYHPPPGHTPGDLQFFSHLAVYSPPPGTQKETIPTPRDSSSTTNTLFCSKTRRFGKNFNYFLEFIERRTLYNKNMNTIFEKEN